MGVVSHIASFSLEFPVQVFVTPKKPATKKLILKCIHLSKTFQE